jgi:hypothetical protein
LAAAFLRRTSRSEIRQPDNERFKAGEGYQAGLLFLTRTCFLNDFLTYRFLHLAYLLVQSAQLFELRQHGGGHLGEIFNPFLRGHTK